MKNILHITYLMLLALTAAATSCMYHDIDIEDQRTAPVIVMHGYATEGGVDIALSRSWFITDKVRPDSLAGADIKMKVNGAECGRTVYKGRGRYRIDWPLKPGDKVELKASKEGLPDAKSETTIPAQPEVKNFSYKLKDIGKENRSLFEFQITIEDKARTEDYYGVYLWRTDTDMEIYYGDLYRQPMQIIMDDEPVFDKNMSVLDGWLTDGSPDYDGIYGFTDRTINGKTYTLNLSAYIDTGIYETYDPATYTPGYNEDAFTLIVGIVKLSEGYYRYLDTLAKAALDDFGSFGIAEPVVTYNNITGGTGVLGSYSSHEYRLHLKLKKPYEEAP